VRVVFLTHNYLGRPGDPGSGSLGALARALSRRGIFVRVVAPSDESGETEVDGVSVSRVRVARSVREWTASSDRLASALRSPLGWLALRRFRSAMRAAAQKEVSDGADRLRRPFWYSRCADDRWPRWGASAAFSKSPYHGSPDSSGRLGAHGCFTSSGQLGSGGGRSARRQLLHSPDAG
jgi:hypothetical protein